MTPLNHDRSQNFSTIRRASTLAMVSLACLSLGGCMSEDSTKYVTTDKYIGRGSVIPTEVLYEHEIVKSKADPQAITLARLVAGQTANRDLEKDAVIKESDLDRVSLTVEPAVKDKVLLHDIRKLHDHLNEKWCADHPVKNASGKQIKVLAHINKDGNVTVNPASTAKEPTDEEQKALRLVHDEISHSPLAGKHQLAVTILLPY